MDAKILLADGQRDVAYPLANTLEREGYDVAWVATGNEVLDAVEDNDPADVVILDLSLPDMDGLELCRSLREGGYDGAIMIVTDRSAELDRVVGLDSGADDYVTKPFGLAELQARVRALLRRAGGRPSRPRGEGALRLDVDGRRVYAGDSEVRLTGKEFDVLSVLEEHRDKVVPRERLMAEVWDPNWFGSTKTLDVTIGRLRQKLGDAGLPDRVVAVRGVGFRLERTRHSH